MLSGFSAFAISGRTSIHPGVIQRWIPLNEAVSSFTWMKWGPNFPVQSYDDGDEAVSFTVFDDAYTVASLSPANDQGLDEQNFRIVRSSYWKGVGNREEILLPAHTVEKILKFVSADERASGVLTTDDFLESILSHVPPPGFIDSNSVYQCSSDLPSRITKDGSIVNEILNHTWLQNGPELSFGMPDTDEGTYFGGNAHIRTPDSFIIRDPKHLSCAPVLIPQIEAADEEKISKKIQCVERSLSLPQDSVFTDGVLTQEWVAHFDYHALERNCLMAVRFVLECAGTAAPQVVNAGIGGRFQWNDLYSVSVVTDEMKSAAMELQREIQQFRNQNSISLLPAFSEALTTKAIELDYQLRGVAGDSVPKTLREICDLSLQKCTQ